LAATAGDRGVPLAEAAFESPGQWWASTGYRHAAGQQARIGGGNTGAAY
jgi:hypothetical protein